MTYYKRLKNNDEGRRGLKVILWRLAERENKPVKARKTGYILTFMEISK
jgi:hypothetical protein